MTKPRTRNTLLLAAFFSEAEVRQLLATRSVHTADEVEARIEKWRKGRALLDQTPDWAATENVVVQDPPADVQAKVAELSTTENFKATVENLPYRVAVVSLGQLIAFQFTVDTPYCSTFSIPDAATPAQLASITLPEASPKFPVQIGGDGGGFVVSAPGPNLGIGSVSIQATDGGPLRCTVDLTFGSPFVQVAEFGGRILLRNGYHRVVRLLQQGVSHAPVIVLQCSDYSQTGAAGQMFFSPHVVMGARPPLLKHYLSPLAIDFEAVELRKTIRIRPDEFLMPVPE